MHPISRRNFCALAACTAGTSAFGPAFAQSPSQRYIDVSPPQLVTNSGKIEVVEVFSYGCIHCAHFQPLIDQWRKRLDTAKVQFVYLPATFNPMFEALAKCFYAADSLGIVEKTHQGVFDAIHVQQARLTSFNDLIDLYARLGVPRENFAKATQSFLVQTQTQRAAELMTRFRVDSTPTLVVAGKYRITTDTAGSQADMLKVADQLIAKELGQTSTSRQAPSKGK